MFALPVVLDGEVSNSFLFYRDANAPYMITLALFGIFFAVVFFIRYRRMSDEMTEENKTGETIESET